MYASAAVCPRDPELAAMEELQHVVTGQEGGPVRLTEEERKQVEEGLAERPDLHEFVSQSLAQQAGGDVPIALPWNDVKVCPRPDDHVCISVCDTSPWVR